MATRAPCSCGSPWWPEQEEVGGSYNRILPFLLGSVPMLDDDRVSLPKVHSSELSDS
ncbi:hypothetical protein [Streptomyces violaceorubidus]|uniref:Uncharacterized protein n=1 Tax=Streptomyces violaceorubidus TaxID=284042 RepID=A0ABV1T4T3_9ACTN